MSYTIRNKRLLKKILWLDTVAGGLTALIGLSFYPQLSNLFGLSVSFILTISSITFGYAVVAFSLAVQSSTALPLLRILVKANWLWAGISLVLLAIHGWNTSLLGTIFLLLQPLVVGGLAYAEGNQIVEQ